MHPVYKVSLELYVWAAQGAWENIFHFTLGKDSGTGHRQPALWIMKDGNRFKLYVSAYVSGKPDKVINPIVDKDTWISIEYGVV